MGGRVQQVDRALVIGQPVTGSVLDGALAPLGVFLLGWGLTLFLNGVFRSTSY